MSRSLFGMLLFLIGATPSLSYAQTEHARITVPIHAVVLPDGVRRFTIMLRIDGRPVEAQLDTGSTGLRVLTAGLSGTVASAKGVHVRYSYGSGVQLVGEKVTSAVGLGDSAGAPVAIERVETVECAQRQPDCPAATLPAAEYRIGGDGLAGQGFLAIIGTGMRSDTVGNPLVALGYRRWIVDLPRDKEAEGRLILNPNDDEISRYREFTFIADSNQVPACLVRTDNLKRICGPAMIDTGASGLRIQGGRAGDIWSNGTPAVIALGDASGTASFPVTIGRRDQASGMFAYPHRSGSEATTLNLGFAPFFHWSILFDADARCIGVAGRPAR